MYCISAISGGAVSYLRNMVPILNSLFESSVNGHRIKFIVHESQKNLLPTVIDSSYIWAHGPRPMGLRRLLWERRHMPRIARDHQADVLFTPYQVGPHVPGVKHVRMIRNMEPFEFGKYRYSFQTAVRNYVLRRQSSLSLRQADRVIAVSGFAEEYLRENLRIPCDRIRRIYHGRDLDFSSQSDLEEDTTALRKMGIHGKFLLTCGSFLPYRRIEDVIVAFNRSADFLSSETLLVIAGSGNDARYAKKIRQLIAASPDPDRIIVLGHVSKKNMATLYRRCLVFLFASEVEACPNIAIEAMSSGCPIISSGHPALKEIFNGCALHFCSRDINGLVLQIRACLENRSLRNELKRLAEERAKSFSWDTCARQTYNALMNW